MILKSQIPQVGDFIRSDLGFWGNLEILIYFTFLKGFAPTEGGGVCLKKVESQTHVWNIWGGGKFWKFYKIVEMLFELLIDWVVDWLGCWK